MGTAAILIITIIINLVIDQISRRLTRGVRGMQ